MNKTKYGLVVKFKECNIPGLLIMEPSCYSDHRGKFVKIYSKSLLNEVIGNVNFKESYFSISSKNVFRGMHFQVPPEGHEKLVYVSKGSILDVVVDLRVGSPSFSKFFSTELSDKNNTTLFIPNGCAHGFLALEDDTCMVYNQTSCYSSIHDYGIHYNSFGFDWGMNFNPIISSRDMSMPPLKDFTSPFIFK